MYKRLVAIILLACLILISTSCNKSKVFLPQPIKESVSEMIISINPLIEMMNIIIYLADDAGYLIRSDENIQYIKDIKNHFTEFNNHAAVQYYIEVAPKGFLYDLPPTICMYINNDFTVNKYYKNSATANEIAEVNGKIHTTKPSTEKHGLGLANIRRAAAKYSGSVNIEYTEHQFMITIFLQK